MAFWGAGAGRAGRRGRGRIVYSASPFPEILLQFQSDDFGPRLSPLAVLPVRLFNCDL
jgi:hypothetical protein